MQNDERSEPDLTRTTRFVWTVAEALDGQGDRRPLLLVLPENVALHWRQRRVVFACTTWGEVRALGPEVYAEVLGLAGYETLDEYIGHFSISGEAPELEPSPTDEAEQLLRGLGDKPEDDQSFTARDDLPACADYDWPPSIYYLMAEHIPTKIINEFGQSWQTVLNGTFASFEADKHASVLAELMASGVEVVEASWLVELLES